MKLPTLEDQNNATDAYINRLTAIGGNSINDFWKDMLYRAFAMGYMSCKDKCLDYRVQELDEKLSEIKAREENVSKEVLNLRKEVF